MRIRPASLFLLLFAAALRCHAAEPETPKDQPIDITSTGETRYEKGIAYARDNVAIHLGDTDIYADSARYDTKTHIVFAEGNVRIYRDGKLYISDRGSYNTDTKELHADDLRTSSDPFLVAGDSIQSFTDGHYQVQNANFSTDDQADPDFHFHARTARIYENDRVIFRDVTFYIGKIPVFWFPYLYQSLNDAFTFNVSPAYLSSWGASLLTQVTFPITEKIKGRVRLDYRVRRGVALGFDSDISYGKDDSSSARITSYFIEDQNPQLNQTALPRGIIGTSRYRLGLEDRTEFTQDIIGIANLTKLSDAYLLQDFYQNEFRLNPVPDNVVALTKVDPIYTLNATVRFQANAFFEQTERLPEIALDVKRTPLFGGPIFYQSETSAGFFNRNFGTSPLPSNPISNPIFEDYGTWRVDTFHQLLYPNTYFGWLSIVPRVGFRATYYGDTRDLGRTLFTPDPSPFVPDFLIPDPRKGRTPTTFLPLDYGPDTLRTIFNAGVEASFKLSRTWDNVQSRALGLDGLKHIIQPFTEFSWVSDPSGNPSKILQFDRFEPTTKLLPLDFPEFTAIDSIDGWTIQRLGVRNRLETRRDDATFTWLEVDTFFDVNFHNPYDRTQFSNLFNKVRFTPVPWASLVIDSQVPAFDKGFTEVNTFVSVQPIANLQVTVGHRYLNNSPYFLNSSLFSVGGYYRFDDNWGVGVQETYEASTGLLEEQRYSVYRDLSSWVASFGGVVRNNGGVTGTGGKQEYGVLLTFTLKAFPKLGLNFNFDPGAAGQ